MKKPAFVSRSDQVTTVGKVFSTPLVVKGKTWLPLVQLIVWPIMAWVARKRRPDRSWLHSLGVGALTMPVVLGSEWGHNLAHAAAARMVGKPMDAMRITWGLPMVIYYDINDSHVTPRQHILRALGGPLFNLLLLPVAFFFKRHTKPESFGRDMAEAAVGTNLFISTISLVPIPGIDGGPILKWSLVDHGRTTQEADTVVRKVNGVMGVALAMAAAVSFKKRRWLFGGLFTMFAVSALSIATGLLKEQE
ncbi:MAG: hypothetical protein HGA53_03755 [Anaerolineaceae bacterium]|nr:hypothetical protein [Anaerolineaceae bacterium]